MSQTVIVLQDSVVLAVKGTEGRKPSIQIAKKIAVTGFGDPYEKWRDALVSLKQEMELSKVRIVLPASLCSTKIIRVPYAKGKKLDEIVKHETADSFKDGVYDYIILQSDKKDGLSICCGNIEKTVSDRVGALFANLGITVTGMTIPLEGYLKVIGLTSNYKNKTAIFLFFDEDGVMRILMQDGNYRFSGKSRIFSEPGGEEYGMEIARNISGIMQFQSASKSGAPITDVYYTGCNISYFKAAEERITEMGLSLHAMNINGLAQMQAGLSTSDWIPAIGAMISGNGGKHELNLISEEETDAPKKKQSVFKAIMFPLIALILCIAAAVVIGVLDYGTKARNNKLLSWIESEDVSTKYRTALELENDNKRLLNAIDSINESNENLAVYPNVTVSLWKRIQKAGGKDISSELCGYDSETGVLNFIAKSPKVIDIPSYVLKLQNTGVFYNVAYTGYIYDKGSYQLFLSCILKADETGGEQR